MFSKMAHTTSHAQQQCMRIPVSPHPCQNVLMSVFDHSHLGRYEMVSRCDFNLHFPSD